MMLARGSVALVLLVACANEDGEYRCGPLEQPGPDGNVPSGYEFCATREGPGFVHRAAVVDVAIDPTKTETAFCDESYVSDCTSNADCAAGSACELGGFGECHCIEKCRSDSDCFDGEVCVPNILPDAKGFGAMAGGNQCRPSLCVSDADCASRLCVLWKGRCGAAGGTRCFEEEDDCRTSADCDNRDDVCRPVDGPFRCDDSGETCE